MALVAYNLSDNDDFSDNEDVSDHDSGVDTEILNEDVEIIPTTEIASTNFFSISDVFDDVKKDVNSVIGRSADKGDHLSDDVDSDVDEVLEPLPNPLLNPSGPGEGSVFLTHYHKAEANKLALLEQHVKVSENDNRVKLPGRLVRPKPDPEFKRKRKMGLPRGLEPCPKAMKQFKNDG